MPVVYVYNGPPGARQAAEQGQVAVIVDALRASGTLATLLAGGAERVLVVAEPEQALALRDELAADGEEALLVGERGGVKLAGCETGASGRIFGLTNG